MKKVRGKPAYLVSATLHSSYFDKPVEYTIQVYGPISNPWVAQEVAVRKWYHVYFIGPEEEREKHKFAWGERIEFSAPRPFGMKIDADEWGL
ncbi:MAG: hypothetical protein RJS97_05110 [Parvibaculaceae bacterium]